LARISGSSSTLTEKYSAPVAVRACDVRMEKPHIGKSGVPFM
jgi:hypothetical protein